jgi:hypothetical protein
MKLKREEPIMNDKETKNQKFKRLATKRVKLILKKLDVLGNCANKHYYEYSEEEVKKIFRTIEEKVKEVKGLFRINENKEFKL